MKKKYVLLLDDFSPMRMKVGETQTLREAKKMAVKALKPYFNRSVTVYAKTPRTFKKVAEIEVDVEDG